jgi:hypothetical protein
MVEEFAGDEVRASSGFQKRRKMQAESPRFPGLQKPQPQTVEAF